MRIDAIEAPHPPRKRWTLLLEDGSRLRVPESAMIDFALHSDMELDDKQLAELQTNVQRSFLREQTARLLGRRNYSCGELRQRLTEPDVAPEAVEETIAWAVEIGLLNEWSYAEGIAAHYVSKGCGWYKIREALYQRQIPREMWDDVRATLPDPQEHVDAYLSRYLRGTDAKSLRRAADALARRGFSHEDISGGLRRFRETVDYNEYEVTEL